MKEAKISSVDLINKGGVLGTKTYDVNNNNNNNNDNNNNNNADERAKISSVDPINKWKFLEYNE